MKIDARLSFIINTDSTEIEIQDYDANIILAKIILTPEQLSKILSRNGSVKCECITGDISLIGKTHENKWFEFEIKSNEEDLAQQCELALIEQNMSEWKADHYYNSQNTFFKKGGKNYARTIIRRWINKK
jgi:hypothetical protein